MPYGITIDNSVRHVFLRYGWALDSIGSAFIREPIEFRIFYNGPLYVRIHVDGEWVFTTEGQSHFKGGEWVWVLADEIERLIPLIERRIGARHRLKKIKRRIHEVSQVAPLDDYGRYETW